MGALLWSALGPGYRPAQDTGGAVPFYFTATSLLEAHGAGTKYTAIAMHCDEDGAKKHEAMGFTLGWGGELDQRVAYAKKRYGSATGRVPCAWNEPVLNGNRPFWRSCRALQR